MFSAIFHKTKNSYIRAIQSDKGVGNIYRVIPQILVICYEDGVTIKKTRSIRKIIQYENQNEIPTGYLILKLQDFTQTVTGSTSTISTGYLLSSELAYNNDELIQSDNYYGYQYLIGSGDTYVFDSGGTYVTNVGHRVDSQVFDTDLNKYYASYNNSNTGTTKIYDVDLGELSTLILTGCPDPISSTYSTSTGKVGILDTYTDKVAIIDSDNESIDGYITLPEGGGYKGIVESDTVHDKMYVISILNTLSPSGGTIYVVNPETLTTGDTIPFTADTGAEVVSMIFNPKNNLMYILQNNGKLSFLNTSLNTFEGGVNLSLSGTYHSMTIDNRQNRLYISNLNSTNKQNVIFFDCNLNSELYKIESVQTNTGQGIVNFNPKISLVFYNPIGQDDLTIINTNSYSLNSDSFENASKYLVNNKIGYRTYFNNFNIFGIDVPDGLVLKETIYSIRDLIQSQDFCKVCVLDYAYPTEVLSQIPYESPYHWYLQNIKSREAWALIDSVSGNTINSSPVEVANLDTIVDSGHPDLIGKVSETSYNMWQPYTSDQLGVSVNYSNLSTCYDFKSESWRRDYLHGIGTTGVLCASNSNNDLMLSASNDKVNVQFIAMRLPSVCSDLPNPLPTENLTTTIGRITAFDKIFQNEKCVVITNQYIWGGSEVEQSIFADIINFVTTNGRNGKGILYFMGAGNYGTPFVVWPGNYNNVYPVGASNALDNKAGFSSYGDGLFICAPGENILSLSASGRYGSDLGLPLFINSGPYQKIPPNINLKDLQFTNDSLLVSDGTSSSAPMVAAVAATMIYVNPSLTKTQVIDILAQTARRNTGTETYDYVNGKSFELGFGIVDHEAAIQAAIDLIPSSNFTPWSSEITAEITSLPEVSYNGEVIQIGFNINLLSSYINTNTHYVSVGVYIGDENYFDNVSDNFTLLSMFGYGDYYNTFEQNSNYTESILIPNQPFGEGINKYIAISVNAFDENLNLLQNGFDSDISPIIVTPNSGGTSPVFSANVVLEQVICLSTGIPCTEIGGYAVKMKIKNVGDTESDLIITRLEYSHNPDFSDSQYETSSTFYTGLTSSNYGIGQYSALTVNEERTYYYRYQSLDVNFSQGIYLRVIIKSMSTIGASSPWNTYVGMSNTIYISHWPTCINCDTVPNMLPSG